MDIRDCRLLIAAGGEQEVRGVAGRRGRGGGSVVVQLLVAWTQSDSRFSRTALVHFPGAWFGSFF